MKKIIGILGITVVAATMYVSANVVSSSSTDTNLASLISMNVTSANAETGGTTVGCQKTIQKGGTWNIRLCQDCSYVANAYYDNDGGHCTSTGS